MTDKDKDETSGLPEETAESASPGSAHPEQERVEKSESSAQEPPVPGGENSKAPGASGEVQEETAFPIVGMGASAGGLEALEAFFAALPAESGLSFVVITHTDPDHESLLPEIIKRKSKAAVKVIQDGMRAEENTVYMPPSNRDPVLEAGVFHLEKRPGRGELHMPVDLFFKHLAKDRGERAGCVILSGTGSDGTNGLRLIKEKGGLVVAQSQESARHRGMPASAADTGLVDYVLGPSEMPERLMDFFNHPAALRYAPKDREKREADPLLRILAFLAHRTRHDFSLYKKSTLVRRIERRMTVTRSGSASEYLRFLHQNPDETRALLQDLLIGVTSFFRDSKAFAFLKEEVVPDLISREGGAFRVWVPGCATGEEAFSVAIIVKECMEEKNIPREMQIFGTDIDSRAIEKARQGTYMQNIAADVSHDRLSRFFVKEGSLYRINREIRESVVFAEQDVLRDPPFSNLDLLVCRNLLIYLESEAQNKLLPLFHYTLKQDGILFLGGSESVSRFPELFEPLSKKFSIYQKKESVLHPQVQFPTGARDLKGLAEDGKAERQARTAEHLSVAQAAERVLMNEHTPACVIVNQNGEILHVHGRTGKYLEAPQGRANLRLSDMAREGLRFALLSAMRRAGKETGEIREKGLQVKTNGGYQGIDLTVKSFSEPPLKGCLMVVFEDLPGPSPVEDKEVQGETAERGGQRVAELEQELMRVRQDHQSAVEELETSNEELRSVNEEMHSSNEELQSTNEELESSREELQSLNEELATVNSELHSKMMEINRSYKAITDVLNSTRIAIVFLDKDLCVNRFTREATRLINLIDSDLGRPIEHISNNLEFQNLAETSRRVLSALSPLDQEVRTQDGHWYRMRVMVHRTEDQVIEGVVLTFANIDDQKKAQGDVERLNAEAVASAKRFAESIVDTVRESLLVLDGEKRVVTANRRFYETFGTTRGETEGKILFELGNRQWDIAELHKLLEETVQQGKMFEDYPVDHRFPEVGFKRMRLNGRLLREGQEGETKILLAIEDVTGSSNSSRE
jgi:two-component system CheB/CheR fusion protein